MEPDVNIIWLGGKEVKKAAPSYVKVVNTSSTDALKAMARADVCGKYKYFRKRL